MNASCLLAMEGIKCTDEAKAIFDIGIEKIAINTQAVRIPY